MDSSVLEVEQIDAFLERSARMMGEEALKVLRTKRLAIAGCGGVGGATAIAFARLGVRHFKLADPGFFDPPDMNRQWGASRLTMGRNKAEVYQELILSIQPRAEITMFPEGVTHDNVESFFQQTDLLIDSLDLSVPRDLRMRVYALADQMGITGISAPVIGLGTLIAASSPGGMPLTTWGEVLAGAMTGSAMDLPAKLYDLFAAPFLESLKRSLVEMKTPSNAIATTLATAVACTEALMALVGPVMPGWRPHVALPNLIAVDLGRMRFSVFKVDDLRPSPVSGAVTNCQFSAAARTGRDQLLTRVGYNVNLIRPGTAVIDLFTDSFAESHVSPRLLEPSSELPVEDFLRALYGYRFVIPVHKGRFAEALLIRALLRPGLPVAATSLFPTTRFHLSAHDVSIKPVGYPISTVGLTDFGGNIDLVLLDRILANEPIQAIFCEPCNNALGGAPLSLANLRAVHSKARQRNIPVILDGARLFDNAALIRQRESGQSGRTLSGIVLEMCSLSDACASSLTKDFRSSIGAFIGVNSPQSAAALMDLATLAFGTGLTVSSRHELAQSLSVSNDDTLGPAGRVQVVSRLWEQLKSLGIPVHEQKGGHAILVNARRMFPNIGSDGHPATTLCAALFAVGGVRASVHFAAEEAGVDQEAFVRLAVQVGVTEAIVPGVVETFQRLQSETGRWRGLRELSSRPAGLLGAFTARYELRE